MGRNEAALVYAGLTLLLVFYMVILPSLFPYLFGGAELFGLYVITVVFVIFAIHIKHSFSGNISKYDISEFRLLWKDDMETAAHSSVIAWALKRLRGLGFIIVVIISSIIGGLAVYLRYYGLISQIDYMLVFLLIMSFIIILVLLIYLFAMFLSHRLLKRGGKRGLHVYREGIAFQTHFLEWKDIKSLSYPKSFRFSKGASMFLFPSVLFGGSVILAIVMARAGITHMLKLTDKKGKVHFAGFYDKKGFEGVLNRLGKSGLFA